MRRIRACVERLGSGRWLNNSWARRWLVPAATVVLSTAVLVSPAQAAVRKITVSLSPNPVVADGSASVATATVTDAAGQPLTGRNITFSPGGKATNHDDGTYTATIPGDTTVGPVTVTATDKTTGKSASATLVRTVGPATDISVQLVPSTLVADGSSTSTATATVTDAEGHPVAGEPIAFSPQAGPTTDHQDGTYTATIQSTTTPGPVTITASDSNAPGATGSATLTQQQDEGPASAPTSTALVLATSNPVTNQNVTLIATVTSSQSGNPPTGAITFANGGRAISGCENDSVAPSTQSVTVVCQTSFAASTAPLTAVFTPSPTANVTGSTSPQTNLAIGKDSTSTSVAVPNLVSTGAKTTFVATVASGHAGPVQPSGSVEFLDNGQPIGSCLGQPLQNAPGATVATCTVSYSEVSAHSIIARYNGNTSFNGSGSTAQAVGFRTNTVLIRGTITALMQWSFLHTPAYTKPLVFVIGGVRIGATVTVQCHGRGCPYAKSATVIKRPKPCKQTKKHKCPVTHPGTVNLMRRFHNHRLQVGAKVTIEITQSSWIGKYYTFTMQARKGPSINIGCIAPGKTRLGVGC